MKVDIHLIKDEMQEIMLSNNIKDCQDLHSYFRIFNDMEEKDELNIRLIASDQGVKTLTKIVDIKKFRNEIRKAACDFWMNNQVMLGLTIEQTLDQMLDCLIIDESFDRDSLERIREILQRVEQVALEGVSKEKTGVEGIQTIWIEVEEIGEKIIAIIH
ncbi:MAG: hypothetical protein ACFE9L_15030 [Candidatus Hodarchaeota archaeon]